MIFADEPDDFTPAFQTVSCFLIDGDRFLLLRRNSGKAEGNRWGIPAGKVDQGEELQAAMARELAEETGVQLPASEIQFFKTVYVRYPDHDFPFHMYRAKLPPNVSITTRAAEHSDHRWATCEEALSLDLVKDFDSCIRLFFG